MKDEVEGKTHDGERGPTANRRAIEPGDDDHQRPEFQLLRQRPSNAHEDDRVFAISRNFTRGTKAHRHDAFTPVARPDTLRFMTSSTPSNSAVPMAHHGYPRSQLEGSSPLARSQQHQAAVADWLYQFEFTSPRLLQQLMGIQYTGWPATKTARALLKKVQLAPQVPRHVYTLTPHGRQLAETRTTQLIPGRVEQEARLAPALVRHELICQWLTLQHIQRGIVSSFMTASALLAAHPDVKDAKVPDVLWTRPDGNVIALEVELTAKWGRRLDDFVLRLARLLHRRELMDHRVDGVLIAVPSRTMAEHYRQAVAPGSPLRQWAKNTRNHWHVEKTSALRAEIASQFEVLVFPSPEY